MSIQDTADRHRNALKRSESAAFKSMNTAFHQIEFELMERAQRLIAELGDKVTVSKFLSLKRTRDLLADVDRLMGAHAQQTLRDVILNLSNEAIGAAQEHVDELIREALGRPPKGVVLPLDKLSEAQIAEIVATTQSGPLADLLDGFGKFAAEKAKRDLLLGVALGEHPSKIAKRLRRSLNVSQSRALLIARTEALRAYREASRQTYHKNKHIVSKWVWSASLSERTCAACWALHGTEFDTDTSMASHPACRCSMVPRTKTWKELGFDVPETRPDFPKGAALFDQQPDSLKRKVLGPQAFDAFKNGDVTLADFIHTDHSREWGTTYRRGSLQNALR